jgi:hypothetical protein
MLSSWRHKHFTSLSLLFDFPPLLSLGHCLLNVHHPRERCKKQKTMTSTHTLCDSPDNLYCCACFNCREARRPIFVIIFWLSLIHFHLTSRTRLYHPETGFCDIFFDIYNQIIDNDHRQQIYILENASIEEETRSGKETGGRRGGGCCTSACFGTHHRNQKGLSFRDWW